MWSFKKKVEAIEQNPNMEMINQLVAWRAIGAEFTYLGRRMIVSGHFRVGGGFPLPMFVAPGLSADYADDHGVIHSIRFSSGESTAIMEQQPNAGGKPPGPRQ